MTPDRDELFLQKTLQEGLHPADRDLWPAVAEALPGAARRQRRRARALRVAVCLCVPLLAAAGALLGRAEFTNLRENPRPSFAPENNTGYAIRFDLTAYELPEKMTASLEAHYNNEVDADGMPPLHISTSGYIPTANGPGGRVYDSWAEMTTDTGLPLLQSELLDSGEPKPFLTWDSTLPEDPPAGSEDWTKQDFIIYYNRQMLSQRKPAGFTVTWTGTSDRKNVPHYLLPRRYDKLDNGYTVETQARVTLANIDRPAGTTKTEHMTYFVQSSGYTWDVEEYTTPSGMVALLPICTSNNGPGVSCYAYFEYQGIYYTVYVYPGEGWGPDDRDKGEEARAVLKQVLDSFTPADAA